MSGTSKPTAAQSFTCRKCHQGIKLLGGTWTDEDGCTNCLADLSAVYTPHDPIPASHPDAEIVLTEVKLTLCSLCLNGMGGQCHVPGCALWMKAAPDVPLWGQVVLAVVDLED